MGITFAISSKSRSVGLNPLLTCVLRHRITHRHVYHLFSRLSLMFSLGAPICGALLSSNYIWWKPVVFAGVSRPCQVGLLFCSADALPLERCRLREHHVHIDAIHPKDPSKSCRVLQGNWCLVHIIVIQQGKSYTLHRPVHVHDVHVLTTPDTYISTVIPN
jgi:hypothetical protein